MPAVTPNHTPKTILTLSAVPDLLPEDDQSASAIERELERVDQGASPDQLIDYVWGDRETPVQYSRAGGRRLVDRITESELRLLDGNR